MIFQSTLMQHWYNLWNPEQPQASTRWKVTSTFCLCVNRELKLGKEPQEKGLCPRPVTGRMDPNPLNYPLKSWILLKRSTKPKKAQQDNSCLFIALSLLSFFCSRMRYSVSQRTRHCVKTSLHALSSHPFPILLSPCLSTPSAPALHFVLFTKEAFSDLPLIFPSHFLV